MPQISLYVDESTLKKITARAKQEGKSISKWVKSKLNESINVDWPEDFFSLYGSIKDDTFKRVSQKKFKDDIPRKSL